MQNNNKMQSETACFSPVPPPGDLDQITLSDVRLVQPSGELDETHASPLIRPIPSNSTSPPVAVRSVVINVPVGLFVFCLFVHLSVRSHISKNVIEISPNSLNMLPVAVAPSSSDGYAIRSVFPATPFFVNNVMSSYNRGNRPESKTMRM